MKHIAVNTRLLMRGKLEGIGRFAHEVLSRVAKNHPETRFTFLFDRGFDPEFEYAPNVRGLVIPPPTRHPLLWHAAFQGTWRIALSWLKPDLFYSPEFYLTSHPSIPQVNTIHDLGYEHRPQDVSAKYLPYMKKYTPIYAQRARKIIAVSEYSKQDIAQTYNISPEKISVVYNASDSKEFFPISATEQQKVRLKYTEGKPYFHFVGTIQPRKNILGLLAAFEAFRASCPDDVRLLIAGRQGWGNEETEQFYNQMRYKSAVHFTGFVQERKELNRINAASIGLCFVPHFEGFGIPPLECMYSETAIIASQVTSIPEVCGDAALYVKPEDRQGISQNMLALYQNPELRRALIEKGRIQKQKFSWDASAVKLWEEMRVFL